MDRPLRVLFRLNWGQPFRSASADERRAATQTLMQQTLPKWKAAGVRLVGYFSNAGGDLDQYNHYMIFEVDELAQVQAMNQDIFSAEFSGLIERYSFTVGWGMVRDGLPLEQWWAAS